jgi:hypothetical protein
MPLGIASAFCFLAHGFMMLQSLQQRVRPINRLSNFLEGVI